MYPRKTIKQKIIAWLDGDLEEREMKELADWIGQSPQHTRYYAQIKDIWETAQGNAFRLAQTGREWETLRNKIEEQDSSARIKIRKYRSGMAKIAAALLIGLLLGGAATWFLTARTPVRLTASAPNGSVSRLMLPDGTEVYLNAGSTIQYACNGKSSREVVLSGEAWFDVRQHKQVPFVVRTALYAVKFTGLSLMSKVMKRMSWCPRHLKKDPCRLSQAIIYGSRQNIG